MRVRIRSGACETNGITMKNGYLNVTTQGSVVRESPLKLRAVKLAGLPA